jgi:hypothetical protein
MEVPKLPNLSQDGSSATTLSAAYNCFRRSGAGTYTLPALTDVLDGTLIWLKHTGAAGSVIFAPAGSDTINGGASANVTLTSGGAGQGQGAAVLASKTGTPTWWVLLKPQ